MSWAEVSKINSNFVNEPLDHMLNVNDIKTFGAEAPILQGPMLSEWAAMVTSSKRLYGIPTIHDLVYQHLRDVDVDNLFEKSGYVGEQLNAFYNTDIFASGNVDAVLAGMDEVQYYTLEDKLRLGYQRYLVENFSRESGVGQWIVGTFGVEVSEFETLSEMINSEEAWNKMLVSAPLMVALASCPYAMNLICESSVAAERIADAIYYIGRNDAAIDVIDAFPELIELVTNDKTSMDWICSSAQAVIGLLQNEGLATSSLHSKVAMTAFGDSTTAIAILCRWYKNMQTSIDSMSTVNDCVDTIMETVPSIFTGTDYTENLVETKAAILDSIARINSLTSMNEIMNNMVAAIINSPDLAEEMASNYNVMLVVADDAEQMGVIVDNEVAMAAIAASEVAMAAIAASEVAMAAIAASEVAMTAVLDSTDLAWAKIVNSEVAMEAVAASSVAMEAVAASSVAAVAIRDSIVAIVAIYGNTDTFSIWYESLIAASAMADASSLVIGKAAAELAGLQPDDYADMSEVAASSTAMEAVAASSTAMEAVAASSTAMGITTKNGPALVAIAKVHSNWARVKSYIMKLNTNITYVTNVYSVLTNGTYFTAGAAGHKDTVSDANSLCTESAVGNGFIAVTTGYYSNKSEASTNVFVNGDEILHASRLRNIGNSPSSVTSSNVGCIAVAPATFTENNDGYMAYAIFKVK